MGQSARFLSSNKSTTINLNKTSTTCTTVSSSCKRIYSLYSFWLTPNTSSNYISVATSTTKGSNSTSKNSSTLITRSTLRSSSTLKGYSILTGSGPKGSPNSSKNLKMSTSLGNYVSIETK